MSTTSPCSCQTERATKGPNNDRPRYYSRQLVTPDDLTLEQDYFRAKLRRHNRIMHGWGVVCGARVVASAQKWEGAGQARIRPGSVRRRDLNRGRRLRRRPQQMHPGRAAGNPW